MAMLKQLIDYYTQCECMERGFTKLKYSYYKKINNAFDGIYQNQVSTYKGFRSQHLFLGVCSNEYERLYRVFWDKSKKSERICVEGTLLDSFIRKDTGKSDWFVVYDQHPENIPDVIQRMFQLADKYSVAYFDEMANTERMISRFELKNPFAQITVNTLPLLYMAAGQRNKAELYLDKVRKSGSFISTTPEFAQFCIDFENYDYAADPDKLPVE